jgi:uncharacterized membrane protein
MTSTNSQFITQNSIFKTRSSQFTILLIIALSFALNLHALAADSFWGDEILTAIFASQSPAEVIRWTAGDIHPPLYYLLSGNFTRLTVPLGTVADPTPASDWLWRFPSVIAVVLTVAVTFQLAFHVHRYSLNTSRAVASSAALLLAVAPIAIKYGQEARMHALFMFLSALSTLLLFRAMARPQIWTRWLAFALATTANIYTMYFGFLVLAAQASFLLFTILDSRSTNFGSDITNQTSRIENIKSKIIGFSGAVGISILLYLPWWPVLFNILRRRAAVGAIEGGVGNPLDFVRGVVQALGPLPEPVAWIFLTLFVAGVIFLARRNRPMAAFTALWLGLPVALPIFLGDPRALQFRYAFVLPVYLTVIVSAVWHIADGVASFWKLPSTTTTRPAGFYVGQYFIWILTTLSFIATLGIFQQTKPDWRRAAAYLKEHTTPADIVLIGPLWDEGRFIDYYYRGQAQLLTPAAMVTNIERRAESMRSSGGRVWAVNRFAPAESPVTRNVVYAGVVVSEPTLAVYEPTLLAEAAIDLAAQAVEAAYPWAAEAETQGVLNPDPRTAQAAALRAWGDTLVAAGRPEEALNPYQTAVEIFPGWVNGFVALAEAQEKVGNLPAAAKAYHQAVAFNLEWQGRPADEAASLVEAGQWVAALEKYHQIVEPE